MVYLIVFHLLSIFYCSSFISLSDLFGVGRLNYWEEDIKINVFSFSFWVDEHMLIYFFNREDFERTGVSKLVTVGVRDIQGDGFPDEYSGLADAIFLDLPQPWLAISSAGKMLKQDGVLCSFSPCIEQVQRSCETLRSNFMGEI